MSAGSSYEAIEMPNDYVTHPVELKDMQQQQNVQQHAVQQSIQPHPAQQRPTQPRPVQQPPVRADLRLYTTY